MKTKILAAGAAGLLSLGLATDASATFLTFGINHSGSVVLEPLGNIQAGTTKKTLLGTATVAGIDGDLGAPLLAGLADGDVVLFSTTTLNTTNGPFDLLIEAGNLKFSFTLITQATIVPTGADSLGFISEQFNGTITGDTSVGQTFLNQTVSLSETCTQTGAGATITCSESLRTPGLPIIKTPEPTALAIFGLGLGLLGLGFLQRRRAA